MTLVLLVMLAPAHLEDLHLFAAAVADDGCLHCHTRNDGLTQTDAFAFPDQEHLVENDCCAHVRRYLFYLDIFAGGNLVLLAAGFYDRVHGKLLGVVVSANTAANDDRGRGKPYILTL